MQCFVVQGGLKRQSSRCKLSDGRCCCKPECGVSALCDITEICVFKMCFIGFLKTWEEQKYLSLSIYKQRVVLQ